MDTVTVRDLRNRGAEVLDRVVAGESLTITRDGHPIAELRPIGGRGLSSRALLERFRTLAPVDPDELRADTDAVLDPRLW